MLPIDSQKKNEFADTFQHQEREEGEQMFRHFVRKCSKENPFKRPTIDELFANQWIQEAPIRADQALIETLEYIIATSGLQTL